MSLGYKNVVRFAGGWYGWLAHTGQAVPGKGEAPGLQVGDFFPDCRLVVLEGDRDRKYLGLPAGSKSFALVEVKSDHIFVEFYNSLCYGCLEEVSNYNHLYELIQADPALSGRLKILGMGVGSRYREVRKFRLKEKVLFPLFADQDKDVFNCLGEPNLPVAYLLKRNSHGRLRIMRILQGHINDIDEVLSRIKAGMTASAP